MTFSCDAATFGSYPTDFLVAAGKIRTIFSLLAKSQMSRSTWVHKFGLSLSQFLFSLRLSLGPKASRSSFVCQRAKCQVAVAAVRRIPSTFLTCTHKRNCFGCKKRVPVACSRHRVFFLVFFVFLFLANFLSWFMWRGRDVICNKGS